MRSARRVYCRCCSGVHLLSALVELLADWYEDEAYPPDGPELADDVEQVAFNHYAARRWGTDIQVVYRQGDQYAAVYDVEPATENQDWGDYGKPDICPVTPREVVTVTVVYDKEPS